MKTHRRSWLAGIAPLLYCILAPVVVWCAVLVCIGVLTFVVGAVVFGLSRLL